MSKVTSKKSDVWSFFTTQGEGKQTCICNLCGRVYKTGGGTTNLKNHILHKHPSCFAKKSNCNNNNNNNTESSVTEPPRKVQKLKITKNNDVEQPADIVDDPDADANNHLEVERFKVSTFQILASWHSLISYM